MDLIIGLLIIFVSARAGGELMEKLRQSPMIGEVLAGILVGPMVLGLIDPNPATSFGSSLNVVANLGVFVLVLLAGIELGREGLRKALQERSMIVAFVEFFLPFSLGYSLAAALGMTLVQSLFVGTALAVTALPVSVRILMDLNLLNSRLGRAIVSVALVNDLVAFAMLGLVVQFTNLGTSAPESVTIGLVVLNNVLFVGLVFCVATILKLTTRLGRNSESYMQTFVAKLRGQEASFALCIATALGLGAAAELLGIHFAVGAFYGGILMTPRLLGQVQFDRIRNAVSSVTFGLFAPIFFAFVGVKLSITLTAWPLIVAITAVAFIGKLLGGILGGTVAGFRGAPLLALGVGLNARGMMELVLAQVGLAAGIIDADFYSALVIMTLTTTLCTPPILKRLMRRFTLEDVMPTVPSPSATRGVQTPSVISRDESAR
ncbi:MAG: cation:proton antiporter [Methanobacteriota archaeon]|nr:MAG: cation:proton antiporter [Euryarchaeota archaeon]